MKSRTQGVRDRASGCLPLSAPRGTSEPIAEVLTGEAFAAQLRQAGVPVETSLAVGLPHDYLNAIGLPRNRATYERAAERLSAQASYFKHEAVEGVPVLN